MDTETDDVTRAMMLDGNAIAGRLQELFGRDMTTSRTVCNNCGDAGEMGALLAFTQAPGIMLRCPACGEVMMRVVETPHGVYFDARGTAHFILPLA